MKVRIQGNSIRYRLKRQEVALFKQTGEIREVIEFGAMPADRMQFVLSIAKEEELGITYTDNTTTVKVPGEIAAGWTDTNTVGFTEEVATADGKKIKILVEKDFKCLDGTEEDNAGSYPNPLQSC